MKILLLCWRDTDHPQGGGSERYLERVADFAVAHGHQVIYRTASYPGAPHRSIRDGVTFLRFGGRYSVYVTAAIEMLLGRFRDVDIVVDTQNGIPFFAKWWIRKPTIVLTHHCHREQWPVAGPVLARVGWFLESRLAPIAYRRSQYVTVSEPSALELAGLGVERSRIAIIRNGVDPVPEFARLHTDGRIHLVTLSRLVPHKQIEHAIDVVAALATQHDVVLDVIGSGWWEQELWDYATSVGVGDRVIFHGHLDETEKHAVLDRAQLHLMPSRKEGWGLAVIEAGQHAVPTIGYRNSAGLRDSVIDGETGVLVADKAALIREVFDLLRSPERAAEMGEAARRRSESFSWQQTGADFLALLVKVAQKQVPSTSGSAPGYTATA
ncbi:glycosyltransferase family 4 protein [Corynebacterium sp. H128]|uniref:glycosyltransferase family 4 protein n=1 Tax=Corynebacterium sp. H128 TaxID=3133427 RepID=UPI0030A3F7E3